jgi:hypothetical protein
MLVKRDPALFWRVEATATRYSVLAEREVSYLLMGTKDFQCGWYHGHRIYGPPRHNLSGRAFCLALLLEILVKAISAGTERASDERDSNGFAKEGSKKDEQHVCDIGRNC